MVENNSTMVDGEILLNTAKALEEIAGEYNQSLKALLGYIYELDSMWAGGAKLTAKIEDAKTHFETMPDILRDYTQALRENVRIYNDAEDEVLSVLNRPTAL